MTRSENLTIMFVDMVGFTERTAHQSRDDNMKLLREYNALLLPLIPRFGGRHIKSLGDALLAVFRSPTDGVHCGMALQDAIAEHNYSRPPEAQVHIRVAINVGEVRLESGDIFGEAINVASRLEGITPQDEIYFTEAVYLAMNKAEVQCEPVGRQKLRGIPEPVRVYRVPPRQVKRLHPGGEDLGVEPGELPYGGMNRQPSRPGLRSMLASYYKRIRAQDWLRVLRAPSPKDWAAGAGAFTLVLTVAVYLMWGPALVSQLNLPALPLSAHERKAAALELLQQGHEAFQDGRRHDTVAAYQEALTFDPGLQNDPQLAERLVSCLSWASESAILVIRQYPSPAIVTALSQRTSQPGPRGRQRAVELLDELGMSNRIDRTGLAIADLQEAVTCDGRLDAIKRLRQLRDPRALPALRETVGTGFTLWFRNSCLRVEAQETIAELEKLTPRT